MKHCNKHAYCAATVGEKRKPSYRGNGISIGKVLKRSFAAVAALVILATAYAMILPALTMSAADCGIEEHAHTEACYTTEKKLVCENTDEDHTHSEACFAEQKVLTCGKESHAHTDECFRQQEEGENGEPVGSDNNDSALLTNRIPEEYKDFAAYLSGVGGSIESFLFNSENCLIDNIYEASGREYTYLLRLKSPYIMPDTYYYYLPESMNVDYSSQTGAISNGSSEIGTYRISEDSSYILFTFDEKTTQYQSITGQITLSVSFAEYIKPAVSKTGWLISPEGMMDGYFHFRISADIPADREGLAKREWCFLDRSEITEQWVYDFDDPVNAANTHIYISYGDVKRHEIFNIRDVWNNENESIAFCVDKDSKFLYLVNRCSCEKPELCVESKDGHCCGELLSDYPEWCTCWGVDDNATVDIEYKNAINGADGTYILHNQNEIDSEGNMTYENQVILFGRYRDEKGELIEENKKARALVTFSAFMGKEETAHATQDNGYTGEFCISLNPQKADLSKLDTDGDGEFDKSFKVTDSMSSLKYAEGSMSITAEDMEGNLIELTAGTDFTVTATQTEAGTDLEILITKLGKYSYELKYNAQVFMTSGDTTVNINNIATSILYDRDNEPGNPTFTYFRRFVFDEQWNFLKYTVEILKVDYADETKVLKDAQFGLYSANDELMAEKTTDENGRAEFTTNAVEGLIFQPGTLYYLQETKAPKGYDLSTVRYWFYFGKERDAALEQVLEEQYPGVSITFFGAGENKEYIAAFTLTNEKCFFLPETGGNGTFIFIAAGALLFALAAGCVIICRIKKRV